MNAPSIGIVTSGYLPVPNVKGGAVEALDMLLVKQNEAEGLLDLVVYSSWNPEAAEVGERYTHTRFVFIHTPVMVRAADSCVYWVAKNVLRLRKHMSYRYILQRLWFIRAVGRRLSKANHDSVVIENHATLFGVLRRHGNLAKYQGRVFFHLHNEFLQDFGHAERIITVKRVLGVSSYVNTTLRSRFPQMRDDQFVVLRNAVDVERFGTADAETEGRLVRKEWGAQDDDVVFLFSGRLTAEKGAEELLQAFIQADVPDAKLVIAGSYFFGTGLTSEFERRLHSLAMKAGNRIVFTGFVPYERMPEVYAAADVCCMPSIGSDSAPMAVIESVASGKPLITTRSGGIPEYVDNAHAVVLERNDRIVSAIRESIERLAHNEVLRRTMAQAARLRKKDLGAERMYADFVREISRD